MYKGVLRVENICQDDFYLIRILAFKVESCIFLVCFCYWPNFFMKGDEGGIFSKASDWKTLVFLDMKIKQNPGSPPKNKNVVFKHFHQNIRPICTLVHFFLTIITHDMNDNQKNNILVSENIKQERLTILEYFNAYHHIMITNVCIEIF